MAFQIKAGWICVLVAAGHCQIQLQIAHGVLLTEEIKFGRCGSQDTIKTKNFEFCESPEDRYVAIHARAFRQKNGFEMGNVRKIGERPRNLAVGKIQAFELGALRNEIG